MSDLLEQAAIKDFFTQNLQIIYIEKKFDLCCHQDSSAQIHQQEVRWSILIEMSGFFQLFYSLNAPPTHTYCGERSSMCRCAAFC